ncbi:MAG: Hsp20/alpha crystallin family protein [Promethearchaeota archaeon]
MTDKNDKRKRKKNKKSRKPPVDDDFDDEEEEEEEELNQVDYFQKMMENIGKQMGPEFFKMVNQMMRQINPNMKDMTPEEMEKMMKEGMKHMKFNPIMFGRMTPGKDGKPNFERFNTIKSQNQQETVNNEEREPLVDVMEEDEEIVVVAEIPGCDKENIELDTTDTTLTITACDEEDVRKYKTTVDLPSKINPDHARARYRNGILEVKLKKVKGRQKGKKISVD